MESLFFDIYLGFFAVQFLIVLVLGWAYCNSPNLKNGFKASYSVIVPFRNESGRIAGLLESMNNLKIPADMKLEFIFVDDQSVDDTAERIDHLLKLNHQIIQNQGRGKKHAIRTGVGVATNELIITWDADISVPCEYFVEITELAEADMWILPVKMNGKKFIQKLVSVDFSWLQILTHVFCKWKQPFLCNGANLVFKKSAFLEAERFREDYDIPSGDDLYLLQSLVSMNKDIRSTQISGLTVNTQAPEDFAEVMLQRKRWMGKMKGMIDLKSGGLFIYLTLVYAVFFAVIIHCIVFQNPWFLLFPVLLKFMGEYLLLRFHKGFTDLFVDLPVVFTHQLFFPFYLLTIVFTKGKFDSRWRH